MSAQMTFLDFFSGIGGFRAGLELCGMKCKGHCEIDKYADRSYRAIYDIKEDEWYGEDITKVSPEELPRVNIWTGGFPCQDVSISGRQIGLDGSRSGLFFEVVRLLKGKKPEDRPEWVILENVKNILSIHGGWDFATVLYSLASLGYNIEYGLLNSKFHGVPQNRERVYIVAYRHFRADSGRKVFPVECSDSEALIQLIGGKQGKRVYDPKGIGITLTASAGGFGGKTGLYFVDLTSGNPKITENVRCIKARYTAGVTKRSGENTGVLCLCEQCPDRESCVAFVQFKRGNPKIRKESTCISAGYPRRGVNKFGESTGVFYGCRAVLTPDREKRGRTDAALKIAVSRLFVLPHKTSTAYIFVLAIPVMMYYPLKMVLVLIWLFRTVKKQMNFATKRLLLQGVGVFAVLPQRNVGVYKVLLTKCLRKQQRQIRITNFTSKPEMV